MLDRDTRRRLSELGRRGRQDLPDAAPGPAAADCAGAQQPPPRPTQLVGHVATAHGPLEELLPGTAEVVAEGEYYELRTPVAAYGEWAAEAFARWLRAARSDDWRLPGPGSALPEETIFLDTETTGLGNEPLFLVGLLSLDRGEPVVTQLLARHYGEEPAVLAEAARRLAAADLLVTYNGATFDLPYVRNRLRYHRLPAPRFEPHLDLLPVARRRLGRSLGNCKLQTLELRLCGRERLADIPGAEIPQAYHDFVADGDAARLRRIVSHNGLDMITLAELAAYLGTGETAGPGADPPTKGRECL